MKAGSWAREALFVLALVPILLVVLVLSGTDAATTGVAGMPRLQALLGLATGSWLVAVVLAGRMPPSSVLVWVVVGGGLALRLLALGTSLELSDDVHRYVFEGGLVAEGESPYAFAPDAPERAIQREEWAAVYARMNHPSVSAAYPPLTQLMAASVVTLAGGPLADDGRRATFAFRLAYGLCDLLVLVPLLSLLRRHGRSPALAVVWAWSPLVVLEFAGSAHFDSLGILLLVGGLAVLPSATAGTSVRRQREVSARASASCLLLGAGVLVKFLPICAIPFALRSLRRRGLALMLVVLVIALGLAVPLGWNDGGRGLTSGLSAYSLRWESFSLVYRWIERPLALMFERDGGLSDPRRVARMIVGVLWLAVLVRAWQWTRDPLQATFLAIGAFLVLTPTLHPWYLTWIIPFLALFSKPAWMLLIALAPLLYWPLGGWRADAVWHEPAWLWPVVAIPFFGWLTFTAVQRWMGARHQLA